MPKAATLQDIATSLGLSKTSVSVAIRGRPGVSDELRAKIRAEAERLGYRPDPLAQELMARIRAKRTRRSAESIAFINTFQEDPTLLHRIESFRIMFEGAVQQGARYGYKVVELRAGDRGMTPARLDQVLKTRGIRGVLVGPRWFDEPEIELDWSAYSCVLVGETTYGAGIYRVCNNHAHTTELALTQLAKLGYRRIGLELTESYERVRHFDFLAGVEPARRIAGSSAEFFVRIVPVRRSPEILNLPPADRTPAFHKWVIEHYGPDIQQWILQERLDAVVTLGGIEPQSLRAFRTYHGRPLGFASLDCGISPACSGIDQHAAEIGEAAIDLLRGLLLSGERGVVPHPRTLLIEGAWIDGETAPPVSAATSLTPSVTPA